MCRIKVILFTPTYHQWCMTRSARPPITSWSWPEGQTYIISSTSRALRMIWPIRSWIWSGWITGIEPRWSGGWSGHYHSQSMMVSSFGFGISLLLLQGPSNFCCIKWSLVLLFQSDLHLMHLVWILRLQVSKQSGLRCETTTTAALKLSVKFNSHRGAQLLLALPDDAD